MTVTLSVVQAGGKAKGKASRATISKSHQLQPGETLRVADVLWSDFRLKAAAGVLMVDSAGADGLYPMVLGDAHTEAVSTGALRYGHLVTAEDERDLARVGGADTQVLLGLREDGAYRTSLWLYNPTGEAGSVELTYRRLDGSQAARVTVSVGAGKAVQLASRVTNAVPKDLGYFSLEARVLKGQLLSGALVVNKTTNDGAFVVGSLGR
jgi:hypothetical protein